MLGPEMLLKSLGFDPEEIAAKFREAQENLSKTLAHFDTRLTAIEVKQELILQRLDAKEAVNVSESETSKGEATNGRKQLQPSSSGSRQHH